MKFQAGFLKSCAALDDLPSGGIPEVALLGRSNVGKSSLLNALAAQPALAVTSRTPGRTRLLNLFNVNQGQLYLVDCPGYGYARVPLSEREQWGELIRSYLETRENLRLCVLLVDAMIPPQAMDLELHTWLRGHERPVLLAATKWDRLSGNQRSRARQRLETAFQAPVLACSAVTGEGREALRERILKAAGASAEL